MCLRSRLKLTTSDLKATLKQATILLEECYPCRLFPLILSSISPALHTSSSRIDSGISTGGDEGTSPLLGGGSHSRGQLHTAGTAAVLSCCAGFILCFNVTYFYIFMISVINRN